MSVQCAKLFAKHFKVEEQVTFLKTKVVQVAVGTPNRLTRLLEDVDYMQDVSTVLVDASFKDSKQRTIFDIPETRKDTFDLLASVVVPRVRKGALKLWFV